MADSTSELKAHLFLLEQHLLQPSTRSNAAALTSLLADDFREFGSSGRIFSRQQIIDELATESPRKITLSDPSCHQLAENLALLTYRSTRTVALKPDFHALRSSIWARRDGRWQMVFHQGTPI